MDASQLDTGGEQLVLSPPLPLPAGMDEPRMLQFFASIALDGAPSSELQTYWQQDWRRFVYTLDLTRELGGACLELGANPYFTTTLLKCFTPLEMTLANYFGPHFGDRSSQQLVYADPYTYELRNETMEFHHFNIEDATFPFADATFDVVLFCEVIEHLQADPLKVLVEIKRILKPGGSLVVTTPNVSRLENVCRMLAGANIYDPYSGYGPYGRHNREYNKHELVSLLNHAGFEVQALFSADVHDNHAAQFYPLEKIVPLIQSREPDLGQYLFSRSIKARAARSKRPAWLYRSYPADELEA